MTAVEDDQSMHERSCDDHAVFHSADLQDSPQCPNSLNSPSSESQLQLAEPDKQCINLPPVKDPLSTMDIHDSDSVSTCDDVSEKSYDGSCSDLECSYRSVHIGASKKFHRKKNTYSVCFRCKEQKDYRPQKPKLVLCIKCRETHGKHKRHKNYFRPADPKSLHFTSMCKNGDDCRGLKLRKDSVLEGCREESIPYPVLYWS